ncbi:tRNA wybutosine-synthesizing protein 5-like [Acanthaster planci]|uniref:tRNA wybutosine-synthesizing protein 5-like n=1 Tax=Acanthaster planci TaxID=133434 RepID=A0A8B7XMV8_ACAPL|nr:tRNA wybutosine-synthesizing protein 5-like [Acanthaster planci]
MMVKVQNHISLITICLLYASSLLFHLVATVDVVEPSHLEDLSDPSPSSWPGHLKPLGSEAVRLPISEVNKFPSPTEFFLQYVYPSLPVVFRRGARRSPAFEQWSDEYLKSLPESQEMIDVEVRKIENRSMPARWMPFAEFLDRYKIHDEYLVTGVPDFLKKDVLVPPPLHCDNITASFLDTVMWFSSGGTKSVLHNDDVDNINCLFSGQKEILFINYTKYRQQIVFDHPEGSYSSVDVDRVDFNKYPEFRDIEFFEAKLEAGDCIYIPYKWYHQVNSINRNIAVNIWWNHKANIIPTSQTCGAPDPMLSLADVKFLYHELMDSEEEEITHPELLFIESPVQSLTTFMEEAGEEILVESQFLELLVERLPMLQGGIWNEEALHIGHKIFKQLDADEDGKITSQDMEKLPIEKEEGGPFALSIQEKLMMLIDVIDEEISKVKEKKLQTLLEKTAQSYDLLTSLERLEPAKMEEKSQMDKDEL